MPVLVDWSMRDVQAPVCPMKNVVFGARTFSAKNRKMLDTSRASLALSLS